MKLIKFIITTFFISILSFTNLDFVHSEGCKYSSQIDQCFAANKNFTTKSIENFVCTVGTYEQIAYQVILDMEFKKIDDEMDLFIEKLERNKDTYFGIGRKKTYLEGINDIHEKSEYFSDKYLKICQNTIEGSVNMCMDDKKVSIKNAKDFFLDKGVSCRELVDKKLEIFDDIAFNILMLNKLQVRADEKKFYDQGQRRNYDKLLNMMMINLGYLTRIWQKWPSKISNAH